MYDEQILIASFVISALIIMVGTIQTIQEDTKKEKRKIKKNSENVEQYFFEPFPQSCPCCKDFMRLTCGNPVFSYWVCKNCNKEFEYNVFWEQFTKEIVGGTK